MVIMRINISLFIRSNMVRYTKDLQAHIIMIPFFNGEEILSVGISPAQNQRYLQEIN